ncbi:MAG: hypothetical protein ABR538_02330 [Candidatus Binatia bacterium]
MGLVILSIVGVAVAMLAMAVGVLFSNRCLRGSCGGQDLRGPDGELLLCDSCPRRRERLRPATDGPRARTQPEEGR